MQSLHECAWHPLQAGKKAASLYARVRKHLGATPLALRVWDAIQEQVMLR